MANLQVGVAGNGTVTVGAGASVHSPASNTLTLGTNGDERVRITNAGLVQVGLSGMTGGDDHALVVNNPANDNKVLELSTSNASGRINCGRTLSDTLNTTSYIEWSEPGSQGTGDLRFATSAGSNSPAERLRITSDGNVLIADTSDSLYNDTSGGGMNLKANGQLVLAKQASSAADPLIWLNDTGQTTNKEIVFAQDGSEKANIGLAGNDFTFATGAVERLRVRADGRVSIASSLAVTGICTAATFTPTEGQLGHRNYIINGSMYYWQRGTSGTNMSANAYLCDRFKAMSVSDGEGAISRDTDVPTANEAGTRFVYSLKVDVTTADTSLAAGQYALITHRIEGRQILDLGFGLAGTRYATLSFWVKAPAGTYGVSFRNASYNRSYVVEYTVSSANTWEKKTMTIPVDTSGTWAHDNTTGLDIQWSLAAGSTFQGSAGSWSGNNYHTTSNQYNLYSSTSNNFFLTGAQFERGLAATPFEWRGEAEELRRVQRYYWGFHAPGTQIGLCNAMARTSDMFMSILEHPVQMRASPSLVTSTTAGHHEVVWQNSQGDCNNSGITTPGGTYLRDFSYPIAGTLNSGSFGSDALFVKVNGSGTVAFNAEL